MTQSLDQLAKDLFTKKTTPQSKIKKSGRDGHLQGLNLKDIQLFIELGINLLMPKMFHKNYDNSLGLESDLEKIKKHLHTLLQSLKLCERCDEVSRHFISQFPKLYDLIESDMLAAQAGDPAADSLEEVIYCYPGPLAIAIYRMANILYRSEIPILPRLMTEYAHQKTGIDIHPGATIGHSFFIDHGTGVVIGETSEIGAHVKVYQGVTLGALSVDKEMAKKKRHPTIEEHCVIYAHATILGGRTTIGRESIIGGNVWVTRSIPSHSLVYHKSEIKHDYTEDFKDSQEITYEI